VVPNKGAMSVWKSVTAAIVRDVTVASGKTDNRSVIRITVAAVVRGSRCTTAPATPVIPATPGGFGRNGQ
jgi:hypothetical protein